MPHKLKKGNLRAVNLSLTYIQEAYEFVRKVSSHKLPHYQSPGQLSELLLDLEADAPELAFEIAFTVLLAPGLDYLYPSQSDSDDFFPKWIDFFNSPIGDDYEKFLYIQQAYLKINPVIILKAEFSPNSSTTYAEAYQLAFFLFLSRKHRQHKKLFDFWLDHIEQSLRDKIKVPKIYVNELRRALETEYTHNIHSRRNITFGKKSTYSIDQITAARIILYFAEKMRKLPYNNQYVEALICMWIVLRINHINPSNKVGITEIRSSRQPSLPKDIGSEYQDLIDLLIGPHHRKYLMPNLTKDIIEHNFLHALNEWEKSKLGDISGDAFTSFPHPFSRFLRIPHSILQQRRSNNLDSKTCEISGRQLLSKLGMPCMATVRSKAIQNLNQPIRH